MVHRGRGLRRQPRTAGLAGRAGHQLRDGRVLRCPVHHPDRAARADELAASAPKKGWQRLSCGDGSKGQRLYDWLLLDPGTDDQHLLLVRRSISKPSELAYYICHFSRPVPVAELVRVAGARWGVEETFQFAKNETGLDHYQVRRYHAWYRHITLSMLAAAFLAVTAHTERDDQKGAPHPADDQLIPLSCNEIRRLWATLTHPDHPRAHTDHWSAWRRLHQTRAKRSHYQRQRLKHHTLRLPY